MLVGDDMWKLAFQDLFASRYVANTHVCQEMDMVNGGDG